MTGVMRRRIAAPVCVYCRRYAEALAQPFALLVGQLVTFFTISVYVKLVEMRLTADYAPAWLSSGRFFGNCLHAVQFCGQEICVFAALLGAVLVWRAGAGAGGRISRAAAWAVGLLVLPALSAIEVLGLAHFALFLTPLGPEELQMIGWTGHIVSAANVLHMPEVAVGLFLVAAGYHLAPIAVWVPRHWQCGALATRGVAIVAAVALAGAAAVAAPAPLIADALLEPHPVLWLVLGNRPEHLLLSSEGIAATTDAVAGHRRFAVKERPTNVLLFVLESTRAESLALYNPAATAGRELLRLQDELVVFDHVYAPVPTSAHAIFSILYGVYPYLGPFWTTGGTSVVADSLAQLFARAGYATQLSITGDLDYDNIRSFAATGFERVLDLNDWPGQERYAPIPWGRDDRLLTDEVKRFITSRDARPFFLFAMTSNPHHPYTVEHVPGAAPDAEPRAAYERLVDYDLHLLAELYEWMKRRGVAERTLLLVLGDHGEAFGEHPGNFGHAAFIYEENVHVPCFIVHPRRLGLPRHIAQLGSQVDLRATILDILGRHDSRSGDGMSLLREDAGRLVATFTENGVTHFGVRDQHFSYIYTPHGETEQVFDRRSDPGETRNLGDREPALTARYRARLQHWETQHQLSLAKVLRSVTSEE